VILRVLRGAFAPEHRDRILNHFRDVVYPATAGIEGLRSFQAGLAAGDEAATEFAIITTWQDFESLVASLGGDLDHPSWMREVEDAYESRGSEHYELVGEQISGVFPLEGAMLRVFQGRLTPRATETFFDFARRRQTELIDQGLMLASHIGRRIVGTAEDAIYVVLWRDVEAIAELGGEPGRPAAQHEWSVFFDTWDLRGYDALTMVAPKAGPEPALLFADDDRRYVFATAAAGRLIGRSVGRILGERIEAITSPDRQEGVDGLWATFLAKGSQEGEYELVDRDGSVRRVRFAARANTPWPGCHASLLVPGDSTVTVDDIDSALSEVGIMARYPVPTG
jgi:PAS domain-containing protein